MFCKKCGFQLKDTARFCPKCGTANTPPPIPHNPAISLNNPTISLHNKTHHFHRMHRASL
ncbi:MAG: zinc-ribbon domain-containing protein [Ruminococcus sp.]